MRSDTQFLAAILLAGLSAGCSGRPSAAQVSGKVIYKDGSVPNGVCVIQFQPSADSKAEVLKAASAMIEGDGSFVAFTRKPGDGVYLGNYDVTFSVTRSAMDGRSLIDEKYTRASTTPYHLTVDGDKSDLKYELEPLASAVGAR